jgi:exonuclease III
MQWIPELERRGWIDVYRHLNGQCETFTWYSPNAGNSYRLDQAFVNRSALPTLRQVQHQWGVVSGIDGPRHILSDHAALILDFG